MKALRWIKEALLWALLALLLYLVGTYAAYPLLRGADLRANKAPMDWIDSAVGIAVLVSIAGAAFLMRLRIRATKRAARSAALASAD